MVVWRHGGMVLWWYGVMVVWCHGGMVSWGHDVIILYCHYVMLPWCLGVKMSLCRNGIIYTLRSFPVLYWLSETKTFDFLKITERCNI